MLLVFGGTTEGRIVIRTLDEGEGEYVYSTRSSLQEVECAHGRHISGVMPEREMIDFCRENSVKIIVDAAHPFARHLHFTISKVADRLSIPVIRLERRYPEIDAPGIIWCADYDDAVRR